MCNESLEVTRSGVPDRPAVGSIACLDDGVNPAQWDGR